MIKVIEGRWAEGENIVIDVNGKSYIRKVYYAKKYGDLFFRFKGSLYFYSEFWADSPTNCVR